jgi:hypothetical protein
LGNGYGPLISRCGLALDNLFAAEVVLADRRSVIARQCSETTCCRRCAAKAAASAW